MIAITVYKNHAGKYVRLHCIGHAGYADSGSDIVCAGVSALVINTLNALEAFTKDEFQSDTDPQSGFIDIRFRRPAGHDAELLLNAMVLGLQEIQSRYGENYSILKFKEV